MQGQRRQSADIKGDVCSSTLNRFPDTWHSGRAHSKLWFRRPVECGAADISLYVPTGAADFAQGHPGLRVTLLTQGVTPG